MQALYQLCRSEPKVWHELPEGTHNDTVAEPSYFQAIDDFIRVYITPYKGRRRNES